MRLASGIFSLGKSKERDWRLVKPFMLSEALCSWPVTAVS
jgi:hypothetical protein